MNRDEDPIFSGNDLKSLIEDSFHDYTVTLCLEPLNHKLKARIFVESGDKCLEFSIQGIIQKQGRTSCKTDFWINVEEFWVIDEYCGSMETIFANLSNFYEQLETKFPGQYRMAVLKDMTPRSFGGISFAEIDVQTLFALSRGITKLQTVFNSIPRVLEKVPFQLKGDSNMTSLFPRFRDKFMPLNNMKPTVKDVFAGVAQRIDDLSADGGPSPDADEIKFYSFLIEKNKSAVQHLFDMPLVALPPKPKPRTAELEVKRKRSMTLAEMLTRELYPEEKVANFVVHSLTEFHASADTKFILVHRLRTQPP